MKTGSKIAIALVGIVLAYVVFSGQELPSLPLTTTPTTVTNTGTGFATQPTTTTPQQYRGAVTMAGQLNNALNATTFTDSTHADLEYFYKDSSGKYNFLVTSASNSATVNSGLTGAFVYVNIDVQASQAVYTDVAGTIAKSPDIKGCVYEDPDSDNLNMWVCQIDISPYIAEPNPPTTPRVDWVASFYGEDSIDLNSPSDILSVGTGNVINVIDWEVTMDDLATAEAVKRVRMRVNTTTAGLVIDSNSYIQLPWEKLYFSDMRKSTDFGNTRFEYEKIYPTKAPIEGSPFFVVGNSGSRTIQVPVTIMTGFTSSGVTDGLQFTLFIDTISSRGIETTTTGKNTDCVIVTTATSAVNKTDSSQNGNCT